MIVPGMFAIWTMDLKRAMAINLRRERHARNLTQEDLADRAGLSSQNISFCPPTSSGAGCKQRTRRPFLSVRYSSRIAEATSSAHRRRIAADGNSQRFVRIAQSAIIFADIGHCSLEAL